MEACGEPFGTRIGDIGSPQVFQLALREARMAICRGSWMRFAQRGKGNAFWPETRRTPRLTPCSTIATSSRPGGSPRR